MEWPTLKYTLQDVDAAGAIITDRTVSLVDYQSALEVVNNWRAAHKFPLNTIQVGLRDRAARVDAKATVAQRMKRLFAIEHKLDRFDWFTLSEMQDIGGCRAILKTTAMADELVRRYKEVPLRHELVDQDDYIRNPKKTGYRSMHLIYRFQSDRSPAYNGRKIEMQIRSRSQHVWATAVEMGGLITGQPLKSGIGDPDWLRFFALVADDMALREGTPARPGAPPTKSALAVEIKVLSKKLNVLRKLATLTLAVESISPDAKRAKNATFLVTLDADTRRLRVETYKNQTEDQQLAFKDLTSKETAMRSRPNEDAILIRTESIKTLEKAYPNYFLDTASFLDAVRKARR